MKIIIFIMIKLRSIFADGLKNITLRRTITYDPIGHLLNPNKPTEKEINQKKHDMSKII
jgi:hypothetical protein